MIKAIFGFILTVLVLIVGSLYLAYGQVEPCKVLSVERARRAEAAGLVAGAVDSVTQSSTDEMSTTECISGLLDSWGERLKEELGSR